jgi:hypothetical protein
MSPSAVARVTAVVRFLLRSSKRIAVTVVGGALVVGGLAMLVLPGPGLLVVVAGFAVLGTEYAWAAHALDRTKSVATTAGQRAKNAAGSAGNAVLRRGRRDGQDEQPATDR